VSAEVRVTPPAEALIVAVWSVLIAAAVAVKVALADPAVTTTFAGTVTIALLLERAVEKPPAGAFPVRETVHVDVPGAFTVEGEHVRPERATGSTIETVPPVAVVGIALPALVDADVSLNCSAAAAAPGVVEIPTVRVATTPLLIVVVFSPKTMQVMLPV
jgi:hypothetical protein